MGGWHHWQLSSVLTVSVSPLLIPKRCGWRILLLTTLIDPVWLLVGYNIAHFSFLPSMRMFRQRRRKHGFDSVSPEARLWWLQYVIPLEPIGLIGFAWAPLGPGRGIPWIVAMIFSSLVGITTYAMHQPCIDYTVAAYNVCAASATGGTTLPATFSQILPHLLHSHVQQYRQGVAAGVANTILAVITLLVTVPVFSF